MQYGDPILSSGLKSPRARRKSSTRFLFLLAIAIPAGLRSQTPMNQTASKPNLAMASHSAESTEPKSTEVPVFWPSSESQTQVLISYNVGYRGHIDMLVPSFAPPFAVSRRRRDCKPILTEYLPGDHFVPVRASPGNLNTSLAPGLDPATHSSGCFLRIDAFVSGQVGRLCWSCKPGPGSFDDFSDLRYHVLANGGEFSIHYTSPVLPAHKKPNDDISSPNSHATRGSAETVVTERPATTSEKSYSFSQSPITTWGSSRACNSRTISSR